MLVDKLLRNITENSIHEDFYPTHSNLRRSFSRMISCVMVRLNTICGGVGVRNHAYIDKVLESIKER